MQMRTGMASFRRNVADLKNLVFFGQLRFDLMIISFFLLLIAALFEGFSFGLLVPFLKQASGMGVYEGWKNIPLMGSLLTSIHFGTIAQRIDLLLCIIVSAVFLRQIRL